MSKNIIILLLTFFLLSSCTKSELALLGIIKPPTVKLVEISTDDTYGYTQENPIRVGGWPETGNHNNQYIYLQQISSLSGEILHIRRVGSCCMFDTSYGYNGKGMLDKWEIRVGNTNNSKILYLNSYEYENPKVPKGFKVKE